MGRGAAAWRRPEKPPFALDPGGSAEASTQARGFWSGLLFLSPRPRPGQSWQDPGRALSGPSHPGPSDSCCGENRASERPGVLYPVPRWGQVVHLVTLAAASSTLRAGKISLSRLARGAGQRPLFCLHPEEHCVPRRRAGPEAASQVERLPALFLPHRGHCEHRHWFFAFWSLVLGTGYRATLPLSHILALFILRSILLDC